MIDFTFPFYTDGELHIENINVVKPTKKTKASMNAEDITAYFTFNPDKLPYSKPFSINVPKDFIQVMNTDLITFENKLFPLFFNLLDCLFIQQPQPQTLTATSTQIIKEIKKELADFHPFFEYNTNYYICDFLVKTFLQLYYLAVTNNNITITLETFRKYELSICQFIYNGTDDFFIHQIFELFHMNYSIIFEKITSNSPNISLEQLCLFPEVFMLQEQLLINAAETRNDERRKNFAKSVMRIFQLHGKPKILTENSSTYYSDFNALANEDTDSKYNIFNSIAQSETVLNAIVPSTGRTYSISSFLEFLLAELDTILLCSRQIILCKKCGLFYVYLNQNSKHICSKISASQDRMYKIYTKALQKYDKNFRSNLAKEYEYNSPSDKTNSVCYEKFLDFYKAKYLEALIEHVTPEQFQIFTDSLNYNDDLLNLKTTIDGQQVQKLSELKNSSFAFFH